MKTIILSKNLTLQKRGKNARAVFVSIFWGGVVDDHGKITYPCEEVIGYVDPVGNQ